MLSTKHSDWTFKKFLTAIIKLFINQSEVSALSTGHGHKRWQMWVDWYECSIPAEKIPSRIAGKICVMQYFPGNKVCEYSWLKWWNDIICLIVFATEIKIQPRICCVDTVSNHFMRLFKRVAVHTSVDSKLFNLDKWKILHHLFNLGKISWLLSRNLDQLPGSIYHCLRWVKYLPTVIIVGNFHKSRRISWWHKGTDFL